MRQKFITKCVRIFITKCDRSLLQNASGFLLQNATVLLQNVTVVTNCDNFITKCDSYYKMRRLLKTVTAQSFIYFQVVIEVKTCLECQKEIQSKVGFSKTQRRRAHHSQESI